MNLKEVISNYYDILSVTPRTVTLENKIEGGSKRISRTEAEARLSNVLKGIEGVKAPREEAKRLIAEFEQESNTETEIELPFELDDRDQADLKDIIENYMPVRNIINDELILVDKITKAKTSQDISAYKSRFTPNEWKAIATQAPYRILKYHVGENMPEEGMLPTPKGVKKYRFCNTYLPPIWQQLYGPEVGRELDPEHKKMIFTRFKDQESLERYFCALYHTLTDRNKTIVGLVHKREGTGKSIVMGSLPGALVGMENYSVTDRNFIQSPHKDVLLEKRAILLDEAVIYRSDATRVKQLTEPLLYVNPKGIKALNVENHISFYLASNNEGDIYTEPTNRRYCFLEDSGKKITEEYGELWVSNYMERLHNDSAFVANLGYFVLNEFKDPQFPNDAIYKGETFERIVRATAVANFGDVIDQLLGGEDEELDYYGAKRDYKKNNKAGTRAPNYPSPTEFTDFFTHFRWRGEPICEVIQGDKRTDILLKPIRSEG